MTARSSRSSPSRARKRADAIQAMLGGATFKAASVEPSRQGRQPGPALHTSTLQQAASFAAGFFSASRTMQVARAFMRAPTFAATTGLITYRRTDGVQMASEAIDSARQLSDRSSATVCARKARFLCH